jgi:hypothetical protein
LSDRVAIFVAGLIGVLAVAVLLVPILLRSESPSPLEFLVAAGEVLLIGFVLRTRRSERVQDLGVRVLVAGLIGVAAAVVVLLLALASRGY